MYTIARESWKYDKRYIVYAVLAQLVSALTPVLAALMPKYMVEEFMDLTLGQALEDERPPV